MTAPVGSEFRIGDVVVRATITYSPHWIDVEVEARPSGDSGKLQFVPVSEPQGCIRSVVPRPERSTGALPKGYRRIPTYGAPPPSTPFGHTVRENGRKPGSAGIGVDSTYSANPVLFFVLFFCPSVCIRR